LSALLKPEIPAPELTHILEAAVYCPFDCLKMRVYEEIEAELAGDSQYNHEDKYYFRYFLWQPYQEYILPLEQETSAELMDEDELFEELEPLSYQSTDFKRWDNIIEDLAHRILWDDEDWKLTSLVPAGSDGADELSLMMGVTNEYLSSRIGLITAEQGEFAYKEIHSWSIDKL
jgi:hypothetical protein